MPPQNTNVGIQAPGTYKYATLVSILIILRYKHLKNSKDKEKFSLTPLIYLKTNSETRLLYIFSTGVSSMGKDWLIVEEETRRQHQTSQTIVLPVHSSMGPFIFPPHHLLSPKRPTSPLPLSYYHGI